MRVVIHLTIFCKLFNLFCGSGGHLDTCYFCGLEGHQKRNCPNRQAARGGAQGVGARVLICYFCGQEGHRSLDCKDGHREHVPRGEDRGRGGPRGQGRGVSGNQRCYNCNQLGHVARDCPTVDKGPSCYRFDLKRHYLIDMKLEYILIWRVEFVCFICILDAIIRGTSRPIVRTQRRVPLPTNCLFSLALCYLCLCPNIQHAYASSRSFAHHSFSSSFVSLPFFTYFCQQCGHSSININRVQ